MKAKVGRGSGFRGVLEYALQDKKGASVIGGTMTTTTPRAMAAEFAVSRQQRPEINRPVWHCSLSLPRSDDFDEQRWLDVATDFMGEIGMPDHQYTVIRHADAAHDHVHIVASRIGLDASVWHGKWEARQAIEATQRLEQRHGLTVTPGLDDAPRDRKTVTRNELEQSERTGEVPVRQRLQRIVDDAVAEGLSVTALCERLEFEGVEVRPNVASTGKLNGLSFSLDGVAFKGSQLGKGYTWSALQKKGITYEPDAESRALRRRAEGVVSRADQEHRPETSGSDAGSRAVPDADARVGDAGFGADAGLDQRDDLASGSDDQQSASVSDGDHQRDHVSDRPGSDGDQSTEGGDRPSGVEPGRAADADPAGRDGPDESDRGVEAGSESAPAVDGAAPERDRNEDRGLDAQSARGGGRGSEKPDQRRGQRSSDVEASSEASIESGHSSRPEREAPALDADGDDDAGRVGDWRRAADAITDLAAGSHRTDMADQPITPAQRAKVDAWRQQSAALAAPQYRITFMPRRDGLKPFNQGDGRAENGGERFYSADEVESLIPYMSRENARGHDVYVTPIDSQHHYLVVDDMTEASHARLIGAGYQPALVQESSADNRQAVLKAPRPDGAGKAEQKAANRVVQMLNQKVGDPEFSGAVHPFRVAGFSNKKPGKQDAFTRLIEATGAICQRTVERLAKARQWVADQQAEQSRGRRAEAVSRAVAPQPHDPPMAPAGHYRWRARNQPSDSDWSGIDFGVAVGMLRDGWQPAQVEQAIIEASPALSDRNSDAEGYARRTVEKAGETPDVHQQPERGPGSEQESRRLGPRRDQGMSM